MMSVSDYFNGFHEMKHNSAITIRINLDFGTKGHPCIISQSNLNILVVKLIFSALDIFSKFLKEARDRQSLINKQNFYIGNYTSAIARL